MKNDLRLPTRDEIPLAMSTQYGPIYGLMKDDHTYHLMPTSHVFVVLTNHRCSSPIISIKEYLFDT